MRLDRLRALDECRSLLAPLDHQGLLAGRCIASAAPSETMDDDELLAELEGAAGASDITEIAPRPHQRREARGRGNRQPRKVSEDFDKFKPLFQQVQSELEAGVRTTRPFVKDAGFLKAEIKTGRVFYPWRSEGLCRRDRRGLQGPERSNRDARLRVIYSNGTESDMLLRSLQRALYKDEARAAYHRPNRWPAVRGKNEDGDQASGTIYVLRSKSDHPVVAAHRDILHKIGVTGGKRRAADRQRPPRPHLPYGRRRNRRDL